MKDKNTLAELQKFIDAKIYGHTDMDKHTFVISGMDLENSKDVKKLIKLINADRLKVAEDAFKVGCVQQANSQYSGVKPDFNDYKNNIEKLT